MNTSAQEAGGQAAVRLRGIMEAARQNQSARAALLITHDPDVAIALSRQVAGELGVPLQALSMASRRMLRPGADSFDAVAGPSADPVDVLRAASEASGSPIILLQDMLRFVGDAAGDPRARALLLQMLSATNRRAHLYLFTEPPEGETHVPSFARTLLTRIVMPLPRGPELLVAAREELAITAARTGKMIAAEVLAQWAVRFAAQLPGLSHAAARYAMQDVLSHGFDLDAAVRALAERKAEHLQAQLAMQVLHAEAAAPVGMDHYFEWLRVYRHLMCVTDPERVKGAVLLGPPGTGKTKLGAYTAHFLGVAAVWFRFGALLGMYVGQSEAAAERAFSVLDALGTSTDADASHKAGVVVVLDELEKTIGRTDNDGGVTMRIVARMLTWMSESRAPNMMLATANDLESMGELADIITRRGRLDRIFFVDVPHRRARQALFERLLPPLGTKEKMDFEELAARSERFSGADIEGVVRDARAEAAAVKRKVIMSELLEQIRRHRVRALASYERFNRVRQWARINAEMAGPGDESE
jgi:hypothetical protein